MFRNFGNPPKQSTQTLTTDPSTGTLVAEIQSLEDRLYEVRWVIGGSTGGIWRLEHCLSSGLASTAIRDQTMVYTGSNQSSEFVLAYKAETGDRFRIVPTSSFSGTCYGKISAEVMT